VRSKRAWWIEHRPDVPKLFDEELERAIQLVREAPGAGDRWPTARHPELRRVQMPKTHNHMYYYVDEPRMTVAVLAVWGAPRGLGPRL
jgi:plasmid stabilization system protein ParE